MASINRYFLALAYGLFATSLAAEGSDFLCITDNVTGFHQDTVTGSWEQTSFLSGERFLITAVDADRYKIERLDDIRTWSAECRPRADLDEHAYTCEEGTDTVHFNRKARKFTAFRYFGYWNGSGDSLSISIGSCIPT